MKQFGTDFDKLALGILLLCQKYKHHQLIVTPFLLKAIPDTKLTIKKYADAKFEYLVS